MAMSDITPPAEGRPPLTAIAVLDLATARTLRTALALLGLQWTLEVFNETAVLERGLYAWGIGRGHQGADALDRPVLYVGVGRGPGGVADRVSKETSWRSADASHVHGRATFRLDGMPVGGPVRMDPNRDLSWLDKISIKASGAEVLRVWLGSDLDPALMAERLCIRIAAHIGDVPPPVNSQFATAWASDAPWDWGGWAAAQYLACSTA